MKTEMAVGMQNIAHEEDACHGLAAIAGRKAWIISDGVAGHQAITGGVADCLKLDHELRTIKPRGIWRRLAPNGPADPELLQDLLKSPLPDIAFGAGRQTVPFMRALMKAGVFTVIFQAPRTWRASADLIWAPAHDRLKGEHVITTLTPPHRFTPDRIENLRNGLPDHILALPPPRVTLLLGGPGAGYHYDGKTVARFAKALEAVSQRAGSFLLTPSRRTPPELLAAAKTVIAQKPHRLWEGHGENPYPDFLAAADTFLVTADSVNMTGEACATGRPVFVFYPSGGRPKFRAFHNALENYGATRRLEPDLADFTPWRYQPLVATEEVAQKIAKRWSAHHQQTVRTSR
ncbi:MAG: mitochondrial fission ELM1 family protein [Hyphomicrobiales bacterium]|nr:mitochondrial fission ELM1 family protein [Hyphomicrobiales bacterium]